MTDTKKPYKWYWAYTSPSIDGITYLFETLNQARDHAIEKGEFDEFCGKESMMAFEEELFFEAEESDLEDYKPYLINEVNYGITI